MAEDDLLIQRARNGDGAAFDALVTPHQARAYRTACLITRDPDMAADALQEALIRAYRALPAIRPQAPFYPWFARIVVNEAIRQARRPRIYQSPLDLLPLPALSPEELLQTRDERERVWSAIQHLSPAHRAVIVLRYYEELSEAEMAQVLDVPPGTVKSRLHHARAALERLLVGRLRPVRPFWLGGEGHD